MTVQSYHNVYLIGIGGIGMSALARWFAANGAKVAGYDRTVSSLTLRLESEGIAVHYEDDMAKVPSSFKQNNENTLVIYTPAVPSGHSELVYFINNGFQVKKRAEVLGAITKSSYTVAVAGTHGKTTTSSMIAHLLVSAGRNCTAFLGGLATNFDSNLVIGDSKAPEHITVVEADEYDRSFLQLHPNLSVITSMEADHMDIYGKDESLKESFLAFAGQTATDGVLFLQSNISLSAPEGTKLVSYGLDSGDARAMDIRIDGDRFIFDYVSTIGEIKDLTLSVPGYHNVENATAATAVALQCGLTNEEIKVGLASYSGVKRRFEYKIRGKVITFIDDYAHHPTEIAALIRSVRALYPERQVSVVFQPHLYSRTRDLLDGFVQSLDMADRVILLDIYPAREEPIPGVSSEVIFDKLKVSSKYLVQKDELLNLLKGFDEGVLLTVGAGDIDRLVEPIKEMLTKGNDE